MSKTDRIVDIHSERCYRFNRDPEAVWAALARVDRYAIWWPWLLECDGTSIAAGEYWRCTVKPPLPYSVSFGVSIVQVVDRSLIHAQIDGDLRGWARVSLEDPGHDIDGSPIDHCTLRLESSLAAVAGPARLIARIARPFAEFGHDWILDAGADRFRTIALDEQAIP